MALSYLLLTKTISAKWFSNSAKFSSITIWGDRTDAWWKTAAECRMKWTTNCSSTSHSSSDTQENVKRAFVGMYLLSGVWELKATGTPISCVKYWRECVIFVVWNSPNSASWKPVSRWLQFHEHMHEWAHIRSSVSHSGLYCVLPSDHIRSLAGCFEESEFFTPNFETGSL